jgi:hypothetical protein
MKFLVCRTSDSNRDSPKTTLEIQDLEALMSFLSQQAGDRIILGEPDSESGGLPTIEIYDDWRE